MAASALIPGGRNCLVRALAAHRMLNRRGIENNLRIGATKNAAYALAAHAWVECDGTNVIGGDFDSGSYATLLRGSERVGAAARPDISR